MPDLVDIILTLVIFFAVFVVASKYSRNLAHFKVECNIGHGLVVKNHELTGRVFSEWGGFYTIETKEKVWYFPIDGCVIEETEIKDKE